METFKIPLGVRLNNPGNLKRNDKDKWQGLSKEQKDDVFFTFDEPVYGIRAMARTLIAYQDTHGCRTVSDFISRYAPPSDNNPTNNYIINVRYRLGVASVATIDVHEYATLRGMIEAMLCQETGQPWQAFYNGDQLDMALLRAGVEPPKKSVMKSAQVIGSVIASTAIAAGPVIDTAKDQIMPLVDYSPWLKTAFLGLSLLGILIVVIAKINERRKGIS